MTMNMMNDESSLKEDLHTLSILYKSGKYEAALEQAYFILRDHPEEFDAVHTLAQSLWMLHRHEEAIQAAHQALALSPDNEWVLFLLSQIHADLGARDEEARYLEQAIRLNPEFAAFHYTLALNIYHRLNHVGSIRPGLKPSLQPWYIADVSRAIGETELAIELRAENAGQHSHLGVLLGLLFRTGEAERHFQEAIVIDPQHAEAHGNYAFFLLHQNSLKQAREHAEQALMLDPRQNNGLQVMEHFKMKEAQPRQWYAGMKQFFLIRSLVAPEPDHYLKLAKLMLDYGAEQPLKPLKAYIELVPDDEEMKLVYGKALFDAGRYPAAIRHFQRMNREQPGSPHVADWLEELSRIHVIKRYAVPGIRCMFRASGGALMYAGALVLLPVRLLLARKRTGNQWNTIRVRRGV